MTRAMRRQETRAVVSDPHRGHRLRDRPGWRRGQQHVFRLDVLDSGRRYAVLRVVRDSRHQLVGAAAAATSCSAVVQPGPAWPPGP
jgi:hypothetical protein